MRGAVKVLPAAPRRNVLTASAWRAVCSHVGCGWRSAVQVVKVAAEDEARWHREQHRRGGAS